MKNSKEFWRNVFSFSNFVKYLNTETVDQIWVLWLAYLAVMYLPIIFNLSRLGVIMIWIVAVFIHYYVYTLIEYFMSGDYGV